MSEDIRLQVDDAVARITLDRPPLNVLSIAMLDALRLAFEKAAASPGVRLIRLDAAGRVFSAGVDVADHVGDKVAPMMEALSRLFVTLEALGPPTIAVVDGAALGGGCELVLGTDLCYASSRASFGQPEIRLGLFAPPASVLLPRMIGERRALELLLFGETIPAAEAERLGIVNRVFPVDELESGVTERLGRLLALSGAALGHAKQAVRAARQLPLAEAQRKLDRLYLDGVMRTQDAHEGLAAFVEKRPARWKHA